MLSHYNAKCGAHGMVMVYSSVKVGAGYMTALFAQVLFTHVGREPF